MIPKEARLTRVKRSSTFNTVPNSEVILVKPIIKRNGRGKARNSTNSNSADGGEDCSICAQLPLDRKRREVSVAWVGCEKCETWYHWACVSINPLDSIDNIDKWYCTSCIELSSLAPSPLITTYKEAPRKSLRDTRPIDYANFAAHMPSDADKWARVLATRSCIEGAFKEYKGSDLGDDWIFGNESFLEPFLIKEPDGLGMTMPDSEMGIHEIARIVGPTTPIEVIDVASQSSLSHWTLQQWANYYTDPRRDKVRNVISLEVSNSPLASTVLAPELVRKLSWVESIWPEELKAEAPRVGKYCLMSVARCWTDWHCDFAGSSVFYHVLRGSKVFYFIRPTTENLEAYEKWSGNAERQEDTWLGDEVDFVYKIELTAGNTMIIPTGWIHAVYTPTDSLVFGGNFLHSLNIATQLRIYEIEIATKVPRKFRFPQFVKLLWFVARHYNTKLGGLQSPSSSSKSKSKALPAELNARILEGLKTLSTFLVEQTRRFAKGSTSSAERKRISKDSVPSDYIKDPAGFVREFRSRVLIGLDEDLDEDCFAPTSNSIGTHTLSSPAPTSNINVTTPFTSTTIKRKRSSLSTPIASSPSISSTKAKFKHLKSNSSKPSPITPQQPLNDGQIISRNALPVSITIRREQILDPERLELGLLWAEIRKTESSLEVVRKLNGASASSLGSSSSKLGILPPVGGGGEVKGRTMEIRRVVTVVERVRWLEDGEVVVAPVKEVASIVEEKVEEGGEVEVELVQSLPVAGEDEEMVIASTNSPSTSSTSSSTFSNSTTATTTTIIAHGESILNDLSAFLPPITSTSFSTNPKLTLNVDPISPLKHGSTYDFVSNPTPPSLFAPSSSTCNIEGELATSSGSTVQNFDFTILDTKLESTLVNDEDEVMKGSTMEADQVAYSAGDVAMLDELFRGEADEEGMDLKEGSNQVLLVSA